jgi:photosystem II stability/assembly factor-like uncharacterized protein
MRTLALAALFITTTAQAQFQIQDSHTTASLRGIHSIGNGVAWASGTEGTILRTTDEGATWQRCTTPPDAEKLDLRGIQAFDQNTAIVMSSGKGDLSRLYKTTDACKTWKLLFTNPDNEGFWDAIHAHDPSHALVLGDSVANKMRIWKINLDSPDDSEIAYEVLQLTTEAQESSFAASNSVLIVPKKEIDTSGWAYRWWWATATAKQAFVYLVRDERGSCEPCREETKRIQVPMSQGSSTAGIFSLSVVGHHAVAVGGDFKKPDASNKTSAFSNDVGLTWTPSQTQPHGYRSSVAYHSKTKTWITVGPNGTDISRDEGRNWTPLKPTAQDRPDADKNWNALSLPFVVGPRGRIGKLRPEALKP